MAEVPNAVETFRKFRLSRVHERYRRQTTDGRTTTYSEREREFTFAKNQPNPQKYTCSVKAISVS